MVGFEPTGLTPQQISSLRRYDHFGTSPYYSYQVANLITITLLQYFVLVNSTQC